MENKKKMITNTACTIGGALLMNGVLQILVYPLFNRFMGAEDLGQLLYIMGLVAIVCPSVGQALNTSRLVVRREYPVSNGDYTILLLVLGGVGCVISLFAARTSLATPLAAVLTVVLLMTTIFRYYGDVEYRLNLNYPKYFCYYAVLSAGYLLGFGLYFLTKSWYLVFITGEALALAYLAVTGTVFRGFWKTGSSFGVAASRGSALVLSYLITNLTLNMDRLALKYMIGDLAVTQYYVTSLLGKTLVILVAPINTILISYLTRQEKKMDRRQFLLFAGAGALVSAVFFLGTQIGTPLFVWLFYRDLYASVRPLTAIVNLTQILSLFSAYLFMVVLTFAEEKWQLLLQSAHLVIMAALVLFFTPEYGIVGFAAAALTANGIRILAVLLLGIIKANHNSKL